MCSHRCYCLSLCPELISGPERVTINAGRQCLCCRASLCCCLVLLPLSCSAPPGLMPRLQTSAADPPACGYLYSVPFHLIHLHKDPCL